MDTLSLRFYLVSLAAAVLAACSAFYSIDQNADISPGFSDAAIDVEGQPAFAQMR